MTYRQNVIRQELPPSNRFRVHLTSKVHRLTFRCKKHHRGTAAYRHWRQRYTLEPCGVERLVWVCVNVCVWTVALTLPLAVVNTIRDIANSTAAEETIEFQLQIMCFEAVCIQLHHCCLSLKIFVYVASSSRFRHELRSTFHLGVKWRRHSVVPAHSHLSHVHHHHHRDSWPYFWLVNYTKPQNALN